jgi:hypothetical protein
LQIKTAAHPQGVSPFGSFSCLRLALLFINQTTPSRFARHPSTGGEFIVPSRRIISNQVNLKESQKSAEICVICG